MAVNDHMSAAQKEEWNAMLARVDKGRDALRQMSLSYGGDCCPTMVVRGLAKLRLVLTWEVKFPDAEERVALQWIDNWLEAGG